MFIFIIAADLTSFQLATIYMANQAKQYTSRIVICFHRCAREQEVRFLPETPILCVSTYNDRLDIVEHCEVAYQWYPTNSVSVSYLLSNNVRSAGDACGLM